jgi:hypothetical protein
MTTAAELIQQTKNHLLGNTREEINTLNGAYTAGGTTLTFTYPMRSILEGAELEIDLELFRVMSVSGQTATVIGAQNGTVAANHSNGSVVNVNPRFYNYSILTNLNHTLHDLASEGLYREVAIDVTFNAVVRGYDLTGSDPDSVLDILEVRYKQTGPTKRFPVIRNWSLMRDMNTTDFPSGTGLVIDSPGFPGLPLRVRYASLFTEMTALTDDVTTTSGLRASADDLPPIGAAIREMAGRDIKRSFLEAQPDTRRSSEVPPGAARNAIATLQRMWNDGVQGERMRQVQRFPYRSR